ncbi:hypothetical protein [Levilactobacillus namurensis]|uniref:Uncharacterized protein n=1 Tax=Levilactobacillus namurensis TaxID=380393 RepID=A0AAW8W288_9LACO|nr:hypothetical protein [Levilactobacillus namurensis]MDT7013592.1 hypothetical protein [Levilactobacillus namurensis]
MNAKYPTTFLTLLATSLVGFSMATMPVQTAQAKTHHTLKSFPKSIRGTWYSYNSKSHRYFKTKITATKMSFGKSVYHLHSRKDLYGGKLWAKHKHPNWIVADHATTITHEHFIHTYYWDQGVGSGDYYQRTSNLLGGKYYPALHYASGPELWTIGYSYHSKKIAKKYANAKFEGDRYNPYW